MPRAVKRKRRRAPKRRGFRRAARRFARRARGVRLGLLGKAGVIVATVPPVAFAAVDAADNFMTSANSDLEIMSKVRLALAAGVQSLTVGFLGLKPFGNVTVRKTDGGLTVRAPVTTSPSGGWATTTTAGLGLIVTDVLQSWLVNLTTKKKGVRMGGHQLTTGK